MTQATIPAGPGRRAHARRYITVHGAVQGVGFRPFVYRQATALGLTGWVRNSAAGVTIEVEGSSADIDGLLHAIRHSPPANARVTEIAVATIEPRCDSGFTIHASDSAGMRGAEILPDLATCEACLAEMLDPADRRYRYPFINCTQCGPRYSIVEGLPYDRSCTSMRRFVMCTDCQAEYDNPLDRRFHAEPNACSACGPRLTLLDLSGAVLERDDEALLTAAAAIRAGRIVAVKGIGGFHLLVDARNEEAVRRLRVCKRRGAKPFAVMFCSLADVRAACRLNAAAEKLLTGTARPIVLLERSGRPVAPSVAPQTSRLGAMLPYSPLHHLLMRELGFPVVATSGNVGGEPIVTGETVAPHRLAGIADLFLVHDRPILRPVDDSVAQIVCGRPQLLRRARGYAPRPVAAEGIPEGILAFGGHLKTTVAVTAVGGVILSQHLGDLETAAARRTHRAALSDVTRLHGLRPRLAVRDLHPDYASTRAAETAGLPVVAVQHHVSHVASCLAEHGLAPPALGIAWDGTGYGPDGTVWGGEFLYVTHADWRRCARLRPFRLPGGEAAAREPRRAALGLLFAAYGGKCFALTDLPPVAAFSGAELAVLRRMLERGVNAPLTSSMGRLFDAFASLCGLIQRSSYEGQAAMMLERAALNRMINQSWDFPVRREPAHRAILEIDWQPALDALLADERARMDVGRISGAFHRGLAAAAVAVAERIGERRVVLTGGCFQNVHLTEATVAALRGAGFEPVWHRWIPPNDGGIALGQAVWASWTERRGEKSCAWQCPAEF